MNNTGHRSNPKMAALQGLDKMNYMLGLGLVQGFFPPHERPHIQALKKLLNLSGKEEGIPEKAFKKNPGMFSLCCSASAMWTANAATSTPSMDVSDGHHHLTPANLTANSHRSLEAAQTTRILRTIFSSPGFAVHRPLPNASKFADEGAANHMRLSPQHGLPGLHVFVYGRRGMDVMQKRGQFPVRQTLDSCRRLIVRQGLSTRSTVLIRQSPKALQAGVFHNDVIALSNANLLVVHADAFVHQQQVLTEIQRKMEGLGHALKIVEIPANVFSLSQAVKSYFFNSQLVTLPGNKQALLLPGECAQSQSVQKVVARLKNEVPDLARIKFFDLKQSMRNGGGPACLRFRVVLTPVELKSIDKNFLLTPARIKKLRKWIQNNYRDRLTLRDMTDPLFLRESRQALDQLTGLLHLGSIYPFQK